MRRCKENRPRPVSGAEHPSPSNVDDRASRLIEQHADAAYRIAFKLTGNAQAAGDLVQDAFLRVMRYIDTYDTTRPFEAWLFQIVRNIYLSSLERESRRRELPLSHSLGEDQPTLEERLPEPAPGPERLAESQDTSSEVAQALETLSAPLKMAVVLVDLEGMSREETARVLGCSLSALDVRLHRARGVLRERLRHLA
jgi:RNA polymerase sigma-70 factor, ECF subfamily